MTFPALSCVPWPGPLENGEPRQVQMLTTIYKKLTSTRLDCARYGHHWESIGFQVRRLDCTIREGDRQELRLWCHQKELTNRLRQISEL